MDDEESAAARLMPAGDPVASTDRLTEQQVVALLHAFVDIDRTLDEGATAQALSRLFDRIYVMGQEQERRKWRARQAPPRERGYS